MNKPVFTASDVGCYIDGARGHQGIRDALADLIEGLEHPNSPGMIDGLPKSTIVEVQTALRGQMSDDDWESDLATDILQSVTDPALVWDWNAGDLCLCRESDLEV